MFEAGRHELEVTIPDHRNGEMTRRTVTLELAAASFFPISGADEASRTTAVQWPPEPTAVQPVSPEAESGERYRFVGNENTVTVSDNPRPGQQVRQTLSGLLRWPEPLTDLFPAISGPDDLFARDQMVAVAERSRRDPEGALHEARIAADRWLSEGHTTVRRGWLEPILAAEGEWEALLAADTSYGLSAGSLEEGLASPAWRDVLERTMHVGRVWGVPGLCWALLIDQLERGRPFRNCERCGRLIQGRSNKRFCAQEDDDACFRRRRAESKRNERRRRSAH